MAHLTEDRVLETSTSTGTGTFALAGAITGFRTFASVLAVSDTCWYYIEGVDANGLATGEWEAGLGTYSATNVLTRTTVQRSSNANAAVTFSAGTKRVGITLVANQALQRNNVGAVLMTGASAEPTVPAAATLMLYSREIVPGYTVLKTLRPSGIDSPVQDDLGFNGVVKYQASNNAIVNFGAGVLTTVGTLAAVTPSSGTAKSQNRRVTIPTTAVAGILASAYAATAGLAPVLRGNVTGEGGFRVVIRFSLEALQSGNRAFMGIADVVTAPTNIDPTTATAPGKIGLAINASTGNWNLAHNVTASAPTLIALGANFPVDTTSLMELVLFCRPFFSTAGNVGYRVRRYTTNSDAAAFETTGTLSTNLPAATTLLHLWQWMTNNATAAIASWNFHSSALQSDW